MTVNQYHQRSDESLKSRISRKRSFVGGKQARRIRFYLLIGLLVTLFLITMASTFGRREFGLSHKVALELIGPLQGAISRLTIYGHTLSEDLAGLWDVRAENKRLRAELDEYKVTTNTFREAVATNIQLRRLLEFKETLPSPTLSCRIIGKDPSLWFHTVIIDRGSSDGIEKGMPAVTVEGVVGHVLDTSSNYSKILLAIDPNSAIDALIQRTRVRGIVKGEGFNAYQLHYVLKSSDVREGDKVVTSDLGGVFPKGMMIGTVARLSESRRGMFRQIEIEPAVDFSKMENLIIVMKSSSLAE